MTRSLPIAWTVARRLALSRDRRQRWRQVSVVAGALVSTVAFLLGTGFVLAGARIDDHLSQRHPVLAESASPTLLVDKSMPIVPGGFSQIPVIWLEPVAGHEDDASIVPPGLSGLPAPGESVLSPGLLAAGLSASDFGFSSSTAGTGRGGAIGDEGLASRSEGFIYARAEAGRTIDSDYALPTLGYGAEGVRYPFVETALDIPTLKTGLLGAIWLLWIPAAYLLLGAARAMSPVRVERAVVLWSLGVSARSIRTVVAMETAVLAVIGSTLGAVAWALGLQHRVTFPLTDGELLPNALKAPLWLVVLVTLGVVTLAAGVAAAGRVTPRARRSWAREVRWADLAPLVISLALMVVAPVVFDVVTANNSSDLILILLFAGAIGTFASLPLALPVLTSLAAKVLRGSKTPSVWLAARTLSLRGQGFSRPGALVGALVFIAGAALALLQGVQEGVATWWPHGDDRALWQVDWRDGRPEDYPTFAARARERGAAIVEIRVLDEPALVTSSTMGEPPASGAVNFASCVEAQQFFGVGEEALPCGAHDGSPLTYLGYAVNTDGTTEGTPQATSDHAVSDVLVSAGQSWTDVDVFALFSGAPAVNTSEVLGDSSDFGHPGVDWLAAGWAAASILLLLGLVRELGDRILLAMGSKQAMIKAGLRHAEADETYTIAAMTPVLIALPIGFGAAVLFALRGYGLGVTTFNVGLIGAVAALVGLFAISVVMSALAWQRRLEVL